MWIRHAVLAAFLPVAAGAETPLTAIDWLGRNSPHVRSGPVLQEPPISKNGLRPDVNVSPLQTVAQPVGLVPAAVTGLPEVLWRNSAPETVANLLRTVPVERNPAMQTLLYTLLLSETRPPDGTGAAELLLLARLDRLMELGATDPAQSLAEAAIGPVTPGRFSRWFDATLLNGNEDDSCAVLAETPYLMRDYAARIFCGARRGDWQTAALTLEAAHALELMPPQKLALLDRFLSPDIFDGAPPLPLPEDPDPLTFRLYETIGESLPTASLPRAFANADLRDIAGWKAQVEAAERLTRIGALPPNRLLGLYTDRRPAASGGVWDRVRALQQFETALDQNSADAVTKTLPDVWTAMQSVQLEVALAELFADRLASVPLTDTGVRGLAWRLRLLSPEYESAATTPPETGARNTYLAALAMGEPQTAQPPDALAQAITEGFAPDAELPARIRTTLQAGKLGEAVLMAMVRFDRGARGNGGELSGALATFRAVGLEDTARRAALQLMILRRE